MRQAAGGQDLPLEDSAGPEGGVPHGRFDSIFVPLNTSRITVSKYFLWYWVKMLCLVWVHSFTRGIFMPDGVVTMCLSHLGDCPTSPSLAFACRRGSATWWGEKILDMMRWGEKMELLGIFKALEHGWSAEDSSPNIFLKQEDPLTFHRWSCASKAFNITTFSGTQSTKQLMPSGGGEVLGR